MIRHVYHFTFHLSILTDISFQTFLPKFNHFSCSWSHQICHPWTSGSHFGTLLLRTRSYTDKKNSFSSIYSIFMDVWFLFYLRFIEIKNLRGNKRLIERCVHGRLYVQFSFISLKNHYFEESPYVTLTYTHLQ